MRRKKTIYKSILLFFIIQNSFSQVFNRSQIDSLEAEKELIKIQYADPATGEIPFAEIEKAREELLKKSSKSKSTSSAISPNLTWYERGPNNFVHDMRCIAKDPNDLTGKKYWAGSLGGGLWFNNDITDPNSSWQMINGGDNWASLNISWITFNPSNSQEIFVATGDPDANFGSNAGSGIYKSIDGGLNFTPLTATIPNSSIVGSAQYAFQFIKKIIVSSEAIWVLTWQGLLKSTDGGSTWSFLLTTTSGSDLEIGNDGIIYVAFRNNNDSKVFRSTNASGNSWLDITPIASNGKIQIALGNSPNAETQIIYILSLYNGALWFKKSLNGGTSWTDITIPTESNGSNLFGYSSFVHTLIVHPQNNNLVLVAGSSIAKTLDGGVTWTSLTTNTGVSNYNCIEIGVDNQSVVTANLRGVYYSSNFSNTDNAVSGFSVRNKNLKLGNSRIVAIKNIAENGMIITPEFVINNAIHTLGTASTTFGTYYASFPALINQNNDNQIVIAASLYDANVNYLKFIPVSTRISDWDYTNNIIYSFESWNSSTNNSTIKITQLTSNNQITSQDVVIPGSFPANYIKVGKTPNTIFIGSQFSNISTLLVKITNINTTPIVTSISNGQLPNATVSSIDLGLTDNEILVTYSNFGVSSVWYTNDGGITWLNKDQPGHGLPNIPIRHAIFAPASPKVILATQLGVFTTNNITDSNPNWEQTNTGLPNVPVSRITFRTADSVLAISTEGRGVFTSAMRGFINPSIDNKFNKPVLCFGGTANVPFELNGTFQPGIVFNVELSNELGSFASPTVVGNGTVSPISIVLPSNIPTGTNYKIRIKPNIGSVISNESSIISIQNKDSFGLSASANGTGSSGTYKFCEGSTPILYTNLSLNLNNTSLPFAWSGPNSITGSGSNWSIPNANTLNQGTYTSSLTLESCKTYTATVNLVLTTTPKLSSSSNRTFCPGQSIIFFSGSEVITNEIPIYSWVGPNNFTSNVLNPVLANATSNATGVYTLTATYTGTCPGTPTATNSITISNTLPSITFYNGLNCNGSSPQLISYINTSTNGLTVSYSWTGPDNFSSTMSNPTISNFSSLKAGIYTSTISYTGACTGSSTSTVNITLSNPTVFISGSTNICSGGSSNLVASLSNSSLNVVYSWAGPNGFTNTGSSLGLTNFSAPNVGTYSVSAAYSGVCTGTATSSITLSLGNIFAFINGSNQYCLGGETNIIAGSSNSSIPVTYTWTGPNSFSNTGPNLGITNFAASNVGTYTLSAVFSGACASTSTSTINLAILSNPSVNAYVNGRFYCQGANANLSSSSSATVTSYLWTGPNGFNSSLAYPIVSSIDANKEGTYTLSAVIGNGCNVTATSSVTILLTSSPPEFVINRGAFGGEYCLGQTNNISLQVKNFENFSQNNISTVTWTGPNNFNFTSSSSSVNISPVSNSSSGIYTANISFIGCTETRTATNSINVSSSPKVTPFIFSQTSSNVDFFVNNYFTASACEGNFVILDAGANSYSGTSFSWSGPNGFISTNGFNFISQPITAAMAGTYTLTATITGGSCAGTASSTVQLTYTETPEPTITYSPENARIGDAVTFASNCTQFSDWSFNNSLEEPNSINFTPNSNEFHTVKCVTNGCISKPSQKISFNDCDNSPIYSSFLTNTKSKFESNDQINSISKISPVSNIVYDSQKSILLNPGFEVLPGSTFKAIIDGCGND